MITNHLTAELSQLHDFYVGSVNAAVANDDYVRVDQLSRQFDRDALELMSDWLGHRGSQVA